jgi:excinuclease ABC subunit B
MSITAINSKRPDSRDSSIPFKVGDKRLPKGDQPTAIKELTRGFQSGLNRMTLLGVTGSGKTFTVAHLIEKLQLPTLIIAHNKTLAAQLYSEFASFFPENAVRYFVSYYDYYQPEAYVPSTDTFIEKDASINEEIDKLRHASTKALLERKDTIVVSSVSCIYGLGDPESYFNMMLYLESGDKVKRLELLRKLVLLQYQRQDNDFTTGTFRVRGDVIEVCTADETDKVIRIELFGDEVESLSEVDRLTGKILRHLKKICIYPASHFVTEADAIKKAKVSITHELEERLIVLRRLGKNLEADRLEQRTRYDIELMSEMGLLFGNRKLLKAYNRKTTRGSPTRHYLTISQMTFLSLLMKVMSRPRRYQECTAGINHGSKH